MLRTGCIFVLFILIASCGNNTQKQDKDGNLLSSGLVNNPYTANGIDTTIMNAKPTMDFVDTTHNFGKLREGETAEYDFDFKNNGKSPLVISQAQGSCGCTVAEYNQEPIAPGKVGTMKVKFNSTGKSGLEEKTVTITTNSKKGIHILHITAEVETHNNQ